MLAIVEKKLATILADWADKPTEPTLVQYIGELKPKTSPIKALRVPMA